jgi:hypothetical protein
MQAHEADYNLSVAEQRENATAWRVITSDGAAHIAALKEHMAAVAAVDRAILDVERTTWQ